MSAARKLGKSQANRLAEIEEQLLYMSEVPDGMELFEYCMNEIAAKADKIDKMAGRLEAMSFRKLMIRVEALENKVITPGSFECRDCSTGSVARMEERVEGLNKAQPAIVQMVSKTS